MKRITILILIMLASATGSFFFLREENPAGFNDIRRFLAAIFFVDTVTEQGLREKYARAASGGQKVKILVVPGHDQEYWGSEFGGVRELDLTLEAAERIASFLSQDSWLDVLVAQDRAGYREFLREYFEKNADEIRRFQIGRRAVMEAITNAGLIDEKEWVLHPRAPSSYATRLYGISKWANENGVDLVVHLHFNDYPRRVVSRPGRHTGFVIYAPDIQYSNARASRSLASILAKTLETSLHFSTFPQEREGIVEDQDLIALGAHNSLNAAAVLIEYGYIYEPQFQDPVVRPHALQEAAFQTYRGIRAFLSPQTLAEKTQTTLLPHRWDRDLRLGSAGRDVLALQAALAQERVYPPRGREKSDCPFTGRFFDCTDQGVRAFQQKRGLSRANGVVDPSTRERLNELYGGGLSSR